METTETIAARYRNFAEHEVADHSPTFCAWALHVADSPELLDRLSTLPVGKQQPNLVFAAARMHGATPGDGPSLESALTTGWAQVRATILERSTQTNEAARCAVLLLGLAQLSGPIALLEVGASAGLCLIPDRYSYVFNDSTRLDPAAGPSELTIPITAHELMPPTRMPDIVWRAGVDLNPLDPTDADDRSWLQTLVWPEHEDRRERLQKAAGIAAREQLRIERADLLDGLATLAPQVPTQARLVVAHSATWAYLDAEQRQQAGDAIAALGAHHLSFEWRGVDPQVPTLETPTDPDTLFVAALDGTPYALADGHGRVLRRPPGW
ncbi:DUF2332 domain-containing protein [Propionibacteriaceae bacterium Y1685]|uniref:DUF2332 domain-containing protein n=1 Tax=Microlunatus sp. Y1700 TaxID=3418487 RepID=UPI003B7A0AB3